MAPSDPKQGPYLRSSMLPPSEDRYFKDTAFFANNGNIPPHTSGCSPSCSSQRYWEHSTSRGICCLERCNIWRHTSSWSCWSLYTCCNVQWLACNASVPWSRSRRDMWPMSLAFWIAWWHPHCLSPMLICIAAISWCPKTKTQMDTQSEIPALQPLSTGCGVTRFVFAR